MRWFHTGGIFAALSETTPDVVEEAVEAATRHGTVVSYDLNYRPSLWKEIGGEERAHEVNRRLAAHVDVMIGNEEDFTACLGLEVDGVDEHLAELDGAAFRAMIERASAEFPNFAVVATTLRDGPQRDGQRLGGDRLVAHGRVRRGDRAARARDPRPRRRRRQLRLRAHLRAARHGDLHLATEYGARTARWR